MPGRLAAVALVLLAALAPQAGAAELERYAEGTWRSFEAMTDPGSGLPADSLAEYEVPYFVADEKVQRWRIEALMRAGYDSTSAAVLAGRSDIDLHRAEALIERGCTPELALRILL